ncbi:DUF982 domain-containing protein [Rhizobium sp. BK251]|uniref:DUF982 domain-containing protein n=1 Tax=Rhizobium sp. BK251 TaxID=2512125 RepID=UPI001046EA3D|nr:DUF982 domain-containing protein [Rhizobium sp. BK251]TCL66444.1 uncharacterized protein DUF982 [Rhizobium sp. BK251]
MHQITDQMSEKWWRYPVIIFLADGTNIKIDTSRAAFNFLWDRWPAEDGPLREVALQACFDHSKGSTTQDRARVAFVEACSEAKLIFVA